MLEKLLVPLDGSDNGEFALAYAEELAAALGSEVRLVCATDKHDERTVNACNAYLADVTSKADARLKKSSSRARAKNFVIEGTAADAILKYAEAERVDLVVLTSHGHGGIMPWPMGGTADKIMHHSHVPLLLVRTGGTGAEGGRFSRILLPLDGSPMGEAAVPYVQAIAAALGSEIVLLRVVETEMRVHSVGGPDHFLFSEQQIEQMKQEAVTYLDEMSKKFPRVNVKALVRTGDPAREILRASGDEDVKVLAMSSHGKSGIVQWVLGSTSNKLLHAGKAAFLLVRPTAKS